MYISMKTHMVYNEESKHINDTSRCKIEQKVKKNPTKCIQTDTPSRLITTYSYTAPAKAERK